MNTADAWALVPLRQLAGGKERLSAALDALARRQLVEAMATDVVTALLGIPLPARQIVLVSGDPEVRALAAGLGVASLACAEQGPDPLNAALAEAVRHVRAEGAQAVLILHADLPRADATSLRALLESHPDVDALVPRATLVPDAAGRGTNCLLLSPPDAIPLAFGADSRARHRANALGADADFREFPDENLAFDVDFPEDLARLVNPRQTPDNAAGECTRAWVSQRQGGDSR